MGIFEKPKGSGIWCVHYDRGVRRREKVGSKSSAKDLYKKRKGDALAWPVTTPQLRKKRVLLGELIDDAVEFAKANNSDVRSYVTKAAIVRAGLGTRDASDFIPARTRAMACQAVQAIYATYNRYKSFMSLCFREGLANGKVKSNPARLVRQKKESAGRLRFLSRAEYEHAPRRSSKRNTRNIMPSLPSVHAGSSPLRAVHARLESWGDMTDGWTLIAE